MAKPVFMKEYIPKLWAGEILRLVTRPSPWSLLPGLERKPVTRSQRAVLNIKEMVSRVRRAWKALTTDT